MMTDNIQQDSNVTQRDAPDREEEYGRIIGPGTVRFRRMLPGPIERVWAFLTESRQRAQWLAAGDMPPRPGAGFTLQFMHAELSPRTVPTPERFRHYDGGVSVAHRVLRWEPPHVMAITWGGGGEAPSEVLFELAAVGERVRLTLTHSRLDDVATRIDVAAGWHSHLTILGQRLAGHESSPFWTLFEPLETDYAQRLAQSPA